MPGGSLKNGPTDVTLRVASYNIRKGGRGRQARIADVLLALEADVTVPGVASGRLVIEGSIVAGQPTSQAPDS